MVWRTYVPPGEPPSCFVVSEFQCLVPSQNRIFGQFQNALQLTRLTSHGVCAYNETHIKVFNLFLFEHCLCIAYFDLHIGRCDSWCKLAVQLSFPSSSSMSAYILLMSAFTSEPPVLAASNHSSPCAIARMTNMKIFHTSPASDWPNLSKASPSSIPQSVRSAFHSLHLKLAGSMFLGFRLKSVGTIMEV